MQKEGNEWKLVKRTFYDIEKPMWGLGLVAIALILLEAFVVWMLVDCSTKPIIKKGKWIVVIFIFNILGAVLYFFIPRRKYIKSQKQAKLEAVKNENISNQSENKEELK